MQHLEDLQYYRAEVDDIARLSPEEEARLLYRIRLAHQGRIPVHLGTLAKRRLVEGYQRLVIYFARYYHRRFHYLHLDDLIQEGNIGLLRAVARCHLFVGETLTPYVAEAISNTILNARRDELPLSMSLYNYRMLRLKGDMKENPFLHICSLDRPMVGKDGELTIADTLAAPPLEPIICEAGEQDEKQALVEALLARVTERQRQLLRLRYGLDPSDAREHSNSEIAAKLQLSETNVCETLQRAIKACRRFSEEFAAKGRSRVQQVPQAPLYRAPARRDVTAIRDEHMARRRREQYAKLQQARATLKAQGKRITSEVLSRAAHVDEYVAHHYLKTYRDPDYEQEQQRIMQQRLEQAYELLQMQGQAVTIPQLCRMAQASIPAANAFLDAKLGDVQARLRVAYEQLQAQGIKVIGKERLAKAAQTSKARAEKFLCAHAVHRQL